MSLFISFIIGLFIGAFFGIIFISMVSANSRYTSDEYTSDDLYEYEYDIDP